MTTQTKDAPAKADSKAAWKKKSTHTVTLPSSAVVTITIPSLAKLIKTGQIPNTLVDAAIGVQERRKVTRDDIEREWEFTTWLIPIMVVDPEVSAEDVADLPWPDIEMLVGFASRNNDMDAVGHQLGGLETQAKFRDFRGIITTDPDLLGV
jgi:hypothetical protein